MIVRKDISKLLAGDIGLELVGTLEDARILDHLTPNVQWLLAEAKKYQRQHNYRFCWVKNYVILLRENEQSDPIQINSLNDLVNLHQAGNLLVYYPYWLLVLYSLLFFVAFDTTDVCVLGFSNPKQLIGSHRLNHKYNLT